MADETKTADEKAAEKEAAEAAREADKQAKADEKAREAADREAAKAAKTAKDAQDEADAAKAKAAAAAAGTALPENNDAVITAEVEEKAASGDEDAQRLVYAASLSKRPAKDLKGVPSEDKDRLTRQARTDGTPRTGITG